ncbi:MAG: hypothetical protein ABI685_07235 [Ferruginibacter sp.]
MSSTTETGHAKNVANFEDLISFCTAYGPKYNPSKEALKVANLTTQRTNALAALKQVKTTETAFNNATNKRMDAFKPLKQLATQIVNALDTTDASKETVKDARTINRKIQGQRAKAKPVNPPPPGELEGASISASQQSYDQQLEHFDKLIELLASDSNYKPNETELTVAALNKTLADLRNANTAVVDTYTNVSNSRINRDNLLYNPLTGLVNTALDVKKYVLAVFKATSPEFKQVNKLPFKVIKSKK